MPYKNTGEWVSSGYWSETENSSMRRGKLFFDKYLKGRTVLDIGCGFDPITENSQGYDHTHNPDFDATFVKEVENESFDVVYASHVLEHLAIPYLAIRNWWRIIKPNGFLIIAVPDRDEFEQKTELPSDWNGEHKFFVTEDQEELPYTINLKRFLESCLMGERFHVEYIKTCRDKIMSESDVPEELYNQEMKKGVCPEYQIETVIRKVGNASIGVNVK